MRTIICQYGNSIFVAENMRGFYVRDNSVFAYIQNISPLADMTELGTYDSRETAMQVLVRLNNWLTAVHETLEVDEGDGRIYTASQYCQSPEYRSFQMPPGKGEATPTYKLTCNCGEEYFPGEYECKKCGNDNLLPF